jgi:hypothetical protein
MMGWSTEKEKATELVEGSDLINMGLMKLWRGWGRTFRFMEDAIAEKIGEIQTEILDRHRGDGWCERQWKTNENYDQDWEMENLAQALEESRG